MSFTGYVDVDVVVVVLVAAAVSARGAGSSTSIATSSLLTDRAAASHWGGNAKGRSASAAEDVGFATGSALDGFDAGGGAAAAPFEDVAPCSVACAAAGVSLADAEAKGSAAWALASAGEVLGESCAGDPFAPPAPP